TAPQPALFIVAGPDAYISPDWYSAADQVPTWNYVAVHLRGTLEKLPQDTLRPVLNRLSDAMEERLPKRPWRSTKMSPGVMDRMMRTLVPCRLVISKIDGTWKLSQNKRQEDRDGAILGIGSAAAPGLAHHMLAAWMRCVSEEP
ncbi:MAG: FMN-binding negative transcriptional regulator, partial [Pseudomonadota bacterium]